MRPSAEEVWRQLALEAGEDGIDRAASVSIAQAETELTEAGFDVASERARATTWLDDLSFGGPRTSKSGIPRARLPKR
jgi:chaperonin GroEL (HSP60 family)